MIGSGGSIPTFGGLGNIPAGVTGTIGVGFFENGAPYWTLRLAGTNTSGSTAFPYWQPESNNGFIAASPGQVWTASVHVGLAAGSLTGFGTIFMRIGEYTSAPAGNGSTDISFVPNTGSLWGQRVSNQRTVSANTVSISCPTVQWQIPNGAVIDATFKIGLPQVEQNYSATSLVLPSVGAPAATTRAAESLTIGGAAFAQIFGTGAPSGFVIADVLMDTITAGVSRNIVMVDAGLGGPNSIAIRPNSAGTSVIGVTNIAGVQTTTSTAGTPVYGSVGRYGLRWSNGVIHACFNGGALVANTTGALPAFSTLRLGSDFGGGNPLNGRIAGLWAGSSVPSDALFQAACASSANVRSIIG